MSLFWVIPASAGDVHRLDFDTRVSYQRSLEEVYASHRIWPDLNGVRPQFSKIMPDRAIQEKVEIYILKSQLLQKYYGIELSSATLQLEMNRMARESKDPHMLKEIWAALDNNPFVIAECLVRPILVDRLLRKYFNYDTRIHGAQKHRILDLLSHASRISELQQFGANYYEVTLQKSDSDWDNEIDLLKQDFNIQKGELQTGLISSLREENYRFLVVAILEKRKGSIRYAIADWPKQSMLEWLSAYMPPPNEDIDPAPSEYKLPLLQSAACTENWQPTNTMPPEGRHLHTAIWTGSEMIIWGGKKLLGPVSTGGRYLPAIDSWLDMDNSQSTPTARYLHTAVWTGTEMIVWGGYNDSSPLSTGGRYNPVNDTWVATQTSGAPTPRYSHTTVWTGVYMIVWGGVSTSGPVATGARYDPSINSWSTVSTSGAPSARTSHTAIWLNGRMIIWGGAQGSNVFNTGGRYNPTTNSWQTITTSNAPQARYDHTAVSMGSEMIVWGGYNSLALGTGGRYDPLTDTWQTLSTSEAPSARYHHSAVVFGSEMLIWGGITNAGVTNTGAQYDIITNTWSDLPLGPLSARTYHTAVSTGTEMIIWGGSAASTFMGDGGRFNPSMQLWTSTNPTGTVGRTNHTAIWTGAEMIVWGGTVSSGSSTMASSYDPALAQWTDSPFTLSPREGHVTVWTGTEMIIWGGRFSSTYYNNGSRYNPATNTWQPVSMTNAPSVRAFSSAVWTGSKMIVWGGLNGVYLSDGASYDPLADSWNVISDSDLSGRIYHSVVWTGSEMIIWGGSPSSLQNENTGARYNPSTNSWTPTSMVSVPSARRQHTAVWSGSKMIVWGGTSGISQTNTGGVYDPNTDQWTPTSVTNAPTLRDRHTAIWDSDRMVVWGGYFYTNTGGIYDPQTDSWIPTATVAAPEGRLDHTAVAITGGMIVWGGWQGAPPALVSGGIYTRGVRLFPSVIPDSTVNVPYTVTLSAGGGIGPYTFSISQGSLPPGFTLTGDGVLSGIPNTPGLYTFTILVADSSTCSISFEYSIQVNCLIPGEVPGLQWCGSGDCLYWDSASQADSYILHRGSPEELPNLLNSNEDSCVRGVYSGTTTGGTIDEAPPPGTFYWYIVTSQNGCGEGSAGASTSGPRIVNGSTTCN